MGRGYEKGKTNVRADLMSSNDEIEIEFLADVFYDGIIVGEGDSTRRESPSIVLKRERDENVWKRYQCTLCSGSLHTRSHMRP